MAPPAPAGVERSDARVASDEGIELFVRQLRVPGRDTGAPIVLVHGGRVPGLASFDLPVPGGSFAADLAAAGHRVFVMDVRGFGGSTRPPEMGAPPEGRSPLVRSDEVVRDIDAVVAWARRESDPSGWRCSAGRRAATGAGCTRACTPAVSHLVLYNTLYGAAAPHPLIGLGSDMEDPRRAGHFTPAVGGYVLADPEASIPAPWDRSIPVPDSEPVARSSRRRCLCRSGAGQRPDQRHPHTPSIRVPAGSLEDSFYLASGRQLWDASLVRAATLIVRSERDFWSRPGDVARLGGHLVHAARVQTLTLPDATHHAFLDRAEHGRAALLHAIAAWLE